MRRDQPLHRVTIGRTRGVRGPDALERGVVGVIIAIVMMLAVGYGVRQMRIGEVVEAVTLARGAQYDAVVYRAVHGAWPSPGHGAMAINAIEGKYVKQTRLGENGIITMRLVLGQPRLNGHAVQAGAANTAPGWLSFRPRLLGVPGYQTVTLLCGYATLPAGPTNMPSTANKTTLNKRDLPPMCR